MCHVGTHDATITPPPAPLTHQRGHGGASQAALKAGKFTTVAEWAQELQRVFLNSICYNVVGPTGPLFVNAVTLLDKLQAVWHSR